MNFPDIPFWIWIASGAFLYLLIGFVHAAVVSYMAGKKGLRLAEPILAFTIAWPFMDLLHGFIWLICKYEDLMDWFKKRGRESVMPPKNSVTDVPAGERYYDSR